MAGQNSKVNLPTDLAAGNYLLRHEIIALHLAVSEGGAEFYAGCVQLSIKGSGTGVPSDSDLVLLPGAYKDDDPGIFTPDVYSMKKGDYQFPGPDVSKLASSGSGNGGDNDNGDSSSSSGESTKSSDGSSPSSTETATSSSESAAGTPNSGVHTNTGSCKLKKRSTTDDSASKKKREHVPKYHSRIMRALASHF